jgi:ABC-type glycerol-3-phosphate transport system permease component
MAAPGATADHLELELEQAHADYERADRRNRFFRFGKGFAAYAVLIVFALIATAPFVYLLSPSLRESYELFTYPPQWIPDTLYWGNFDKILNETSYLRWGLNTLVFATAVTLITLVIDTLAGYAFARLRFRGRTALFVLVIGTLMIPTAAIVAPLYIMVSNVPEWTHAGINTYLGMILPMCVSPLGVFMMRQFISTLPEGLVEAARLDGASEFQIFRKVVLPLMKPAIVVLGIFTFMMQWVNFLWPLVITTTDQMKTLTVGIASLQGQFVTEWGVISAASVMTMLPVLVIFLIFQRWFVQASMAGALKQ